MAVSLAKKFIRQISQPFDHSQTGISLWTVEDIEEKQRKDQEEAERAIQQTGPVLPGPPTEMRNGAAEDVDMEFGIEDAEMYESVAVAVGA